MCLLAKKRKGLKSFLAESREKNWNYLFYPSAKSRRELKTKTLGVTFRGASAYYVQKSIAPQKQAVCRFSDEFFFWRKFSSKNFAKKIFSASKNEMLGIVWNAFSQSFTPIGAIFGRFRTVDVGAPVSSAAPKKKSFDRGGPVWPPRSNAADDRLGGGIWARGLCPPSKKLGVLGGIAPQPKSKTIRN